MTSMNSLAPVAVFGPTASGKSALGLELAHRLGGEVVNVDSMQLYRGMDIGTAKLPVAQRRGIPHHLFDVLDVVETATAAWYPPLARETIDGVRSRGAVPILVGGSGLYVRAALDAIEFPGTDPGIRARREDQLRRDGRAVLLRELARVDPESAARVKDDRRLVRALEVHDLTGRPFTSFMPQRRYVRPTVQIGLAMDRDELNGRLARRVDLMLERGWLDEVRALAARGLRESPTAGRALGYPQLLAVLDGTMTLAQAREDTVAATRRFTKRQRTWFRADPRVHWIECSAGRSVTDLAARALEIVRAQ